MSKMYTCDEVAERYKVKVITVWDWIRQRKLNAIKLGREYRVFDDNGVKHFSSKLLVGDYMSLDNPRLIIDRKQNLQELCGNVCQQHERFKRELLKAIDAGIQLVILVEHGADIKSLEDVWFWENPRKHEVRWRMVNGKREKYVVSAKAVDGNQLYKSLCTIRDRYNVRFEFCEKKDTGKEIIRILSGDAYD